MTFTPRQYQTDAINAWLDAVHDDPEQPWLIAMATGLGKSLVALMAAEHAPGCGHVLYAVHRTELVEQTITLFADAGWRVLREQAHRHARRELGQQDVRPTVVVASRDSLVGQRLTGYDPRDFKLGIVDEAHRAHDEAPTYQAIMKHFALPWLGFTATPGEGMGGTWQIVYQMTLSQGIDEGWLTPAHMHNVRIEGWDWSSIVRGQRRPTVDGTDIDLAALERLFDGEEGKRRLGPAQRMIRTTLNDTGHQAVVFAPGVPVAKALSAWLSTPMQPDDQQEQEALWRDDGKSETWIQEHLALVSRAVRSDCVTGKTPKDIRGRLREALRDGRLDCLVNVFVYVEGVDIPDVDRVVILRPTTKSWLFLQMIGRVLRPHSSIKHLLGSCATKDERKALIASSPKPLAHVDLLVPRRCKLDLCSPYTLAIAERPDLAFPKHCGNPQDYEGTLEEIIEQLERERLAREEREREAQFAAEMREAEAQRSRSQHLVDDIEWRQTSSALGSLPELRPQAMHLTYSEYKAAGGLQFVNSQAFTAAKKALVARRHGKLRKTERRAFERVHGPVENRHWRRWTGNSRVDAVPRYRTPKQWEDFVGARKDLRDKYREWLYIQGEAPKVIDERGRALYSLSEAWTMRGISNEWHVWEKAINPKHENPRARFARTA